MQKQQPTKTAKRKDQVERNTIKPMTAGKQKIKDGDAGFDTETSGLNEPVRRTSSRRTRQ